MTGFRRWQLDSQQPYTMTLAADARLSRTDYADDQSWELRRGEGDAPALALQTRYGGRAGLASIVPLWIHEGRTIYQALTYAKPPILTAFAPAYARLEAELLPKVLLTVEYLVFDSHSVGGCYTLKNNTKQALSLRLEAFAHVGVNGLEQKIGIVALDHGSAVTLGSIGDLQPVILQENSTTTPLMRGVTPKIGTDITIAAGKSVAVRWVHAGRTLLRDSLALGAHWLKQDWGAMIKRVIHANSAIPQIETGDAELDAVIAFSYQQLAQAFLKPTDHLPYGSFVAARQPVKGYSASGSGREYDRTWNGQNVQLAYLAALPMATIDAAMAQGVIKNYLALQGKDGAVDSKPGLGGQREDLLCAPLLARAAWAIYQYTRDAEFVRDVFAGLLKFFERWFAFDADKDNAPEWQHERQTGYVYFPTFGLTQTWAQGAAIDKAENPDLLTYLLSEALALREMAALLGETKAHKALDKSVKVLDKTLNGLWSEEWRRFVYRDRDTHAIAVGTPIVENQPGDEEALPSIQLSPANRVVVSISGGVGHTPDVTLTLMGFGANGQAISEVVKAEAFAWRTGGGRYTSKHVFAQLDRVRCEGLSRVYKISVRAVDLTGLDVNAALPLWSGALKKTRAADLVKLLTDQTHFWQANGITMVSAQDARYDPTNEKGAGGIWLFWNTLLGEGLIESGQGKAAAELAKRLMRLQAAALREDKAFSEFYHTDEAKGLGEQGHLAGIAPLHLLTRLIGVAIPAANRVMAGGAFGWGSSVTVTQHGVVVKRGKKEIAITFPSGHQVTLPGDAEWQEVIDPMAGEAAPVETDLPAAPAPTPTPETTTVQIEVEYDD